MTRCQLKTFVVMILYSYDEHLRRWNKVQVFKLKSFVPQDEARDEINEMIIEQT